MSEWQPIESAPKDGRPIIAFIPAEEYAGNCLCVFFDIREGAKGRWKVTAGSMNWHIPQQHITHWMPLPEPPK